MALPVIKPTHKTGEEPILSQTKKTKLLDFWQWAYSDILGNTERGILAEYFVALACGIENQERISWDAYDLKLENGIKVEVKSSAYIQTWEQKDYSKPIFGIQKTIAWDSETNVYDKEKKRQADIYVFCLLAHKDQDTINPLDTSQWEFFVLPTSILNKELEDMKTVTLSRLIEIGAAITSFEDLLRVITDIRKIS